MTVSLYEIVHRASDRRYYGITALPPRQRWQAHQCDARKGRHTRIARAVAKYGRGAFDWRVLALFNTRDEAADAERFMISEMRPAFNITAGGDGCSGMRHSEASRAKMRGPRPALSVKCKARAQTAEGRAHLDRIRCTTGHRKGWVVTPEISAKMSASAKARCTPEWRASQAAVAQSTILSAESQAKAAAARMKYPVGTACVVCGRCDVKLRGLQKCSTCYTREYARARRARGSVA